MVTFSIFIRVHPHFPKQHALSRLPLPVTPAKTNVEPEMVLLAEHLAESPVSAMDIRL